MAFAKIARTFGTEVTRTIRTRGALRLCVALVLGLAMAPGIALADLPPAEKRTELAGNSLSEYPFFEYVKAFNENATVEVAIDPSRFRDIDGETGDIYLVDAKTQTEWESDPSLTDVAGGPLTVTFGGLTIQDNTFLASGPYDLSGDAGTGLGVGYDVVIDMDRDGTLSYSDYIDGLGYEAGLYVVHDVSQPGPLAVTEITYSGGSMLGQDTYYPTSIASMEKLPLIVISHGNGHNYTWYDHIGYHMASYGYIVMSHTNNTVPGIETASTTTLTNTSYIIQSQATIGGGVLDGHIDSDRITWIGHSRGAEGITRAYDRIRDEGYDPGYFTLDDVILLSSMLPTDFLKTHSSNPHDANYHLWTPSGDADVSGSASCDLCQTFHLHERATKYRQSTVVQGTGHGDFHDASGSVFSGPCHITPKDAVHEIMLGYFLPLIKYYVDGNIPAGDFLWRQYESFHPIGVDTSNPCIVVTHEHRNGSESGNFMVDDYESQTSTGTSSSGGPVTYTVSNLTEGRLDDGTSSFSWSSSDPFNGATQDSSEEADNGRGVVFDWNGSDRYYEWEIIASKRDFSSYLYLSFRGAQGTQHPNTLAVMGDLTFSVSLQDGTGVTSSINIGAYGGGLEQPYDRSGGWHNEMEVVKIRLTDFLTNGSGLDLSDIEAIRLDCGPSWGSNEGRIVVDELMLTSDVPPPIPGVLAIQLPDGAPYVISPEAPTSVTALISGTGEFYVPGSGTLHYSYDGGAFQTSALMPLGGDLFEGILPAPYCDDTPEYYFSAEGTVSGVVTLPLDAPATIFASTVGEELLFFHDDFETDKGWTTEVLGASSGAWERGVPVDDDTWDYDPPSDSDGSGQCYLTQNEIGNTDVDNGSVRLTSPTLDLSSSDFLVTYDYFLRLNDEDGTDRLLVEVNANGGVGAWTEIARHDTNGGLEWRSYEIDRAEIVAAGVTPTATTHIRYTANDGDAQSIVEAGLDAFKVFSVECDPSDPCADGALSPGEDRIDCGGPCPPCECTSDAACDDGLFCTGDETCDEYGQCWTSGDPCVDGSACTDDVCYEGTDTCDNPCLATGPEDPCCADAACSSEPICICSDGVLSPGEDRIDCGGPCPPCECTSGAACDDGLFCTGDETCNEYGLCLAGIDPCVDGIACSDDVCYEGTDSCDFPCLAIDPEDPCCEDPVCSSEPICICSDGVLSPGEDRIDCGGPCPPCECTSDGACNDGLFCTGDETCDEYGQCQTGTDPCADGSACSDDVCYESTDTCDNPCLAIDPEDPCCADPVCSSEPICICSDGVLSPGEDRIDCGGPCPACECTSDAACDDGLFCTGVESCDEYGQCQTGTDPCVDGSACSDDVCHEDTDTCNNPCLAVGPEDPCCADPACSGEPICVCSDGVQGPGEDRIDCGGPCPPCECTSDAACDDGLFCTGDETCDEYGMCQASGDPCIDGSACSDDVCHEETETCDNPCLAVGPEDPCCADPACSEEPICVCSDGVLSPGEDRIDCGGPCPPCECTSDAACDDGLFCTGDETCDAYGQCQTGTDPCVDGSACSDDICHEDTDSCDFPCLATGPGDPCCSDPACSTDPVCGDFTLMMDVSFEGGILSMDFTVGTPVPVTWGTYLILLYPSVQVIPLWQVPIPAIHPPMDFPISFPLSVTSMIGIYTGLFTEGVPEIVYFEWIFPLP